MLRQSYETWIRKKNLNPKFKEVDDIIYECRVNQNWERLELALDIVKNFTVFSRDLDNFKEFSNIHIIGWNKSHTFVKSFCRILEKEGAFKFKLTRRFRKDLAFNCGKRYAFSGFDLSIALNDKNLEIEKVNLFLQKIINFLDQEIRRKSSTNKSDFGSDGFVDQIFFTLNNKIKYPSWLGYVVHNPVYATTLLESINDQSLADNIYQSFEKLNFRRVFPDEYQHNLVTTKLSLIAKKNNSIGDFNIFSLTDIEGKQENLLKVQSPIYFPAVISSGFFKYEKTSNSNIISEQLNIINDVYVRSDGRVLRPDSVIKYESSENPYFDFVAGRWQHEFGSCANLTKMYTKRINSGRKLDSAIHLLSRVDGNWFHWLIETLPRLVLVKEFWNKRIPILVSNRVSKQSLESLRLFVDNPVIVVHDDEDIYVRNLVLAGPCIFHPDTAEISSQNGTVVNVRLLSLIRNHVFRELQIKPERRDNIYLLRHSSHRKMRNQVSISETLRNKLGFKSVDPSTLSFREQVNLFANVKTLVTPGGAAMTNFIFFPSESKAVTLISELGVNFFMPSVLASIADSQVYSVTGKINTPSVRPLTRQHLLHNDFQLKKSQVIKCITQVI